MAKEDCTNCGHAKWPVTKSGRRQLSKNGECIAAVLLPNCFMTYSDYMPTRSGIHKHTCRSRNCALWKPAGKKNKGVSPDNNAQQLNASISEAPTAAV